MPLFFHLCSTVFSSVRFASVVDLVDVGGRCFTTHTRHISSLPRDVFYVHYCLLEVIIKKKKRLVRCTCARLRVRVPTTCHCKLVEWPSLVSSCRAMIHQQKACSQNSTHANNAAGCKESYYSLFLYKAPATARWPELRPSLSGCSMFE